MDGFEFAVVFGLLGLSWGTVLGMNVGVSHDARQLAIM